MGVGIQLLGQGEPLDGPMILAQSGPGVLDQVGPLHEVVDAQGRGETGAASGRQDVVGARKVVAHRFAGIGTEEDGPASLHLPSQRLGFPGQQLQVLGSDAVDDPDRLPGFIHDQNRSIAFQRLANGPLPAQFHDLTLEAGPDGFGQIPGKYDGQRHRGLIVLGLGHQIGGHEVGMSRFVGDHHHFRRSGNLVDIHQPVDLPLGRRYVGVAGTHDLVDPGHGFGPVGQGGDRLGAPHPVDLLQSQLGQSRRHHRVGLEPGIGGDHHNAAHPRDLSRDSVHEQAGRIGRGSPRHIQTHTRQGRDSLSQPDPIRGFELPGLLPLPAVKGGNVLPGLAQDFPQLRIHPIGQGANLPGVDPQRAGLETLQPQGPLPQGGVSLFPHRSQDGGNARLQVPVGLRSPRTHLFQVGAGLGIGPLVDRNHRFKLSASCWMRRLTARRFTW